MKQEHLRFGKGFHVTIGNARAQAAQMMLSPGENEGGADNRHRGTDQWLFVVSGSGLAIVNGKRHELRGGSLVLIEHGDTQRSATPAARSSRPSTSTSRPPTPRAAKSSLPASRSQCGPEMATYTVRQGKRYRAILALGFLERLASNEMIAKKLREAGFTEVTVSGSGANRATAEMPAQVTNVIDV